MDTIVRYVSDARKLANVCPSCHLCSSCFVYRVFNRDTSTNYYVMTMLVIGYDLTTLVLNILLMPPVIHVVCN